MKKQIALSVIAALLFLCGLMLMLYIAPNLGAESGQNGTTLPDTTAPSTTDKGTTVPDTTKPDTTVPDTTVPDTTVPDTTVPDTTEPETTEPPTTVPPTTAPPTTQPPTTQPPTTEPPTTVPPTTSPEYEYAPGTLGLAARYAFAFDCSEGRFVYHGGSRTASVAPASLTKLMTALVVLEHMDPGAVVTVGQEVTWIAANSSVAWLAPGQKLTVKMLIQGLIMQSGNDAAYTLAVACGRVIRGDSNLEARAACQAFVDEMNATARKLGMNGTQYKNPDGIDESGHYTTVNDLVTLSLAAMKNSIIMEFAGMHYSFVTFESGQTAPWTNSNLLLDKNSDYYCEAAIGLKTGSTSGAGKCLIALFKTDDGYLLTGVLGCPSDKTRYTDTLTLYDKFK